MEKIYLIIAVILAITTIVLWVKYSKVSKTVKDANLDKEQAYQVVKNKNSLIETLQLKVRSLDKNYAKIEIDLQDNLRFKLPDGEIAHNLKVKTFTNDKGEIAGYTSTIRRKVNGVYTEIPVVPFIQR